MKQNKVVKDNYIISLYIPHGSDNTEDFCKQYVQDYVNFISHMVQIIPNVLFQSLSYLVAPLYPTWFR